VSGGASPRPARHGEWRLLYGAEVDERIRKLLGRGRTTEQAAVAAGVAIDYVRALIRDEGGDDAPPGDTQRERPPPPETESPTARSRVACMVAGAEIGARECVERQCGQRCFCPRASFAINALAPHALPGTRLEEQLAACRAVARSVLLKSTSEERHLGPALRVLRGEAVDPAPLIAGDLPAPPAKRPTLAETWRQARGAPRATAAPPAPAPPAPSPKPGSDEVAAAVLAQRGEPSPPPKNEPLSIQEVPATAPVKEEETMPRPSKLDAITDDALRALQQKHGTFGKLRAAVGCSPKLLSDRLARLGTLRSSAPPIADPEPRLDQDAPERPRADAGIGAEAPPVPDEFETMRQVLAGFRRLSSAGQHYVMSHVEQYLAGRSRP
jgi:hypothetical protein